MSLICGQGIVQRQQCYDLTCKDVAKRCLAILVVHSLLFIPGLRPRGSRSTPKKQVKLIEEVSDEEDKNSEDEEVFRPSAGQIVSTHCDLDRSRSRRGDLSI